MILKQALLGRSLFVWGSGHFILGNLNNIWGNLLLIVGHKLSVLGNRRLFLEIHISYKNQTISRLGLMIFKNRVIFAISPFQKNHFHVSR